MLVLSGALQENLASPLFSMPTWSTGWGGNTVGNTEENNNIYILPLSWVSYPKCQETYLLCSG